MSVTLHETFTIDGALADVTSVKLSDPTSTFGVKRNDNDAVIVADGTAMVKVSIGTYEYTFTEPEGGLTYTYWVEWLYSGETYHDEHTITGTTDSPISLAEAKHHLRVDGSDDDTYIANLILTATDRAESFQRRTYMQRQRTYVLDSFPPIIRPPYPPLVSVDSIKYIDTNGVEQTLDSAEYDVDITTEPGRIKPAYEKSWPSIRTVMNAVTITYTAGYASKDAVPFDIKAAILLIIGHLYENREDVSEDSLMKIPEGAESLLYMKRVY